MGIAIVGAYAARLLIEGIDLVKVLARGEVGALPLDRSQMGQEESHVEGHHRPARVLLVDDHLIFRQAIRDIFREWSVMDLEVVGEARNGQEAIELCRSLQPDLVLMDISMPGMDGLEATRAIKREFPSTIVLMLSALEHPNHLLETIKAGASGYMVKDLTPQRLIDAIRRVLRGESPINQELAMRLIHQMPDEVPKEEPKAPTKKSSGRSLKKEMSALEALTPRELEVLGLIAAGRTNRQIAQDLRISQSTVKTAVQRIIEKLEVSSRTEAAVQAHELGLLLSEEQEEEEEEQENKEA